MFWIALIALSGQSVCFLKLSCLSYNCRVFSLFTKAECERGQDLCKLNFGMNGLSKGALHKQITLLSEVESTKPWLSPPYPKAAFIIGAFSDLIWNSRMEIPHIGLLDLLENNCPQDCPFSLGCPFEMANQNSSLHALLVSITWPKTECVKLCNFPKEIEDGKLSAMDLALPLSIQQ